MGESERSADPGFELQVLDALVLEGTPQYTGNELAEKAGIDIDVAERLWRAMGFTVVPRDERLFVAADIEAIRSAVWALDTGTSLDTVVYQTRVIAAALARVAEVTSDGIVQRFEQLRESGVDDSEIAARFAAEGPPDIDRLIGYFYRRQLRASLWRKLANPERQSEGATHTVGFVDLVRFTEITEDLDELALGELIDRFESLVHEMVTANGGRIVKMIGDEVMFVSDSAESAVTVAMALVEAFEADDSVPNARAGLAAGSMLAYGGDYFGPVVNLAARIVDIARPSTVVISDDLHDLVAGHGGFSYRSLPPMRLKGIGRSPLFVVRRADQRP